MDESDTQNKLWRVSLANEISTGIQKERMKDENIEQDSERKQKELEEAERVAEEFRAQGKSIIFSDSSRVKFKNKTRRIIKVKLDHLQ